MSETNSSGPVGVHLKQWAGAALALAGVVALLGIITGEAVYPVTYTTHDNEVSDLGATRPPDSITYDAPARVFNSTMMVTGFLTVVAAMGFLRVGLQKKAWIPVLLLGIGAFGVGVFPGNYSGIHPLFALTTFGSGTVAALLSAGTVARPLRWLCMALGVVAGAALGVGIAEGPALIWDELGKGGVERWVAYPIILWMVTFGAHAAADDGTRPAEGFGRGSR